MNGHGQQKFVDIAALISAFSEANNIQNFSSSIVSCLLPSQYCIGAPSMGHDFQERNSQADVEQHSKITNVATFGLWPFVA